MSLNPLQSLQATSVCFGNIAITPGQGVFKVPANQSALISSVRVVNVHATTTATVNVRVKPAVGTTAFLVAKKDTTLATGTALVLSDYITLGAGESILIDITAASAPSVDWSLEGVVAN
jgi:hypothetical protein